MICHQRNQEGAKSSFGREVQGELWPHQSAGCLEPKRSRSMEVSKQMQYMIVHALQCLQSLDFETATYNVKDEGDN